jgi:thiosulfate dehydrogenase [quinone] large subunit
MVTPSPSDLRYHRFGNDRSLPCCCRCGCSWRPAGWLRAGVEKVIEPEWWTGELLAGFLTEQRSEMLPFFRSFSDAFVAPFTGPVAWLVVEAQIAIGLCLLLGRHTKQALWAGVVLNLTFVMSGRVNPSAFYLVMEMVLLFALSRPVPTRVAVRRAALWTIPAVAVLPFARTIVPAEVIDDPALMLGFVAGLAALTTLALAIGDEPLTIRRHTQPLRNGA